ncbi:hypothetical protein ACLSY8_09435 [Avibacterium avium]|uniref:hypothetical protein n=1 Tax=Avibacterium TaxID=292486 RepID=UPI003BF8EC59
MKFSKTLLATVLFSFSILGATQVAYAYTTEQEKQFQQALDAAYNNDFDTAFKLFQSLEKQGVSEAEYNLGLC